MRLQPHEQPTAQAHKAPSQFAHTVDVVVSLGPVQNTFNLFHTPTSLHYQLVGVNMVKFDSLALV
jgi:hypothetical protein